MHPSGLTDRQVAEIQDLWKRRTTIVSLAETYGTTTAMIRKIIAAPDDN